MNARYLFTDLFVVLALISATIMFESISVQPVSADSEIVVNSAADDVDDDGVCTLREAIHNANNDEQIFSYQGECAAGAGADIISFVANYTITIAGNTLPTITTPITIIGQGPLNTIIQASTCNPVVEESCPYSGSIFDVASNGTLNLEGLAMQHSFTGSGGGVYNKGTLTVKDTKISRNRAIYFGGGIFNEGTLTIVNSTLSENRAGFGGGLSNIATLRVTGSTLSGNMSSGGGGVLNDGENATATITNSTLSANSALYGGGIVNQYGGTLAVANSTLYANQGGGIHNEHKDSGLLFVNTIIALSTNSDCSNYEPAVIQPESTHNLIMDGSCDSEVISDIKLGPLADNGGLTLTHALLPGSPAIDAGNQAACAGSLVNSVDQRGITRPYGAGCDIGAFEFNGFLGLFYLPMILK